MTPPLTIEERVGVYRQRLSPVLRRAADFLVENPEEVASRSLRDIADRTNLTAPTYSRLARALGFNTYEELRELCRDHIKRRRLTFADKAMALQTIETTGPANGAFVVRHGIAVVDNINRLLDSVDIRALETAADNLAQKPMHIRRPPPPQR